MSWEIAYLKSTCAIHFCIKPKRKRVRKCRGGRRKVRKIKVLTILKHQNRYGGQVVILGNLIEIISSIIFHQNQHVKNFFALVSSTPGPLVRMRNEPK